MSEEKSFLNAKGITVTSARFVVNNKTYPMSAIDSVKYSVKNPDITVPVVFLVVGVASFWLAKQWWYALVLLAIAVGWWFFLRKSYTIELELSSGPQDVYTTHNKDFVNKVIAALNEAIIHRESSK